MPIVATNHRVTTNQRCRALHIATRTVAGSRLPWWAGRSVVIAWVSWGLACRTDAPPDARAVYEVGARTTISAPGLAPEGEQPMPLCLESDTFAGRERFEWLDRKRRPVRDRS